MYFHARYPTPAKSPTFKSPISATATPKEKDCAGPACEPTPPRNHSKIKPAQNSAVRIVCLRAGSRITQNRRHGSLRQHACRRDPEREGTDDFTAHAPLFRPGANLIRRDRSRQRPVAAAVCGSHRVQRVVTVFAAID